MTVVVRGNVVTLGLSPAQASALECSGLFDGGDLTPDEDVLRLSIAAGDRLVVTPNTRDACARAVNEISNSEDALAQRVPDQAVSRGAAGAARALANLYAQLLRLEFVAPPPA